MRIKISFFIFFLFSNLSLSVKTYASIPDTLNLADVSVVLSPRAKDIVETEYLLMGRNLNYIETMLEKMNLYLPTIEKILSEKNVPLDFKYLCIQESSLNPSATSPSKAVGFWQFKKETAIEVGMTVNDTVDERRHIIESTRGAANYFLKNKAITNNWIGALLSHRLGLGGYRSTPHSKDWANQNTIVLDEKTDWYILRYLAQKLFWENAIAQFDKEPKNTLEIIPACGINLGELCQNLQLDSAKLKLYNPWLLSNFIPNDKEYQLIYFKPLNQELIESKSENK